jgi:hypothetical protein
MPRPKKSNRINQTRPASLTHPSSLIPHPSEEESSPPATALAQVPVEDLIDELRHRGFLVAKADEGRPEPVEASMIETIYDEVLAQELERRGWECFPPDGPDA